MNTVSLFTFREPLSNKTQQQNQRKVIHVEKYIESNSPQQKILYKTLITIITIIIIIIIITIIIISSIFILFFILFYFNFIVIIIVIKQRQKKTTTKIKPTP